MEIKKISFWSFLLSMLLFSSCEIIDELKTDNQEELELEEEEVVDYLTHQYNVPIIFHVIYNDSTSATQYVTQSRISYILGKVNDNYSGMDEGVDMKLQFELAKEDEFGNSLDEVGVNRIYLAEGYPINSIDFMTESDYKSYIWDPNQYVNVFLYNFENDDLLGISHMPYIQDIYGDKIDGLSTLKYDYLEEKNLSFPYGVSINSSEIFSESNAIYYNPNDVIVTLTHELGHYFGLFHTFFESDDEDPDLTTDPDYCNDTESYLRAEYEDYYINLYKNSTTVTYQDLIKRFNLDGEEFTSDNYLDYSCSLSDKFTQDQYDRVRTVLNYSLLIPGPKNSDSSEETKSSKFEGVIDDIPINVVTCNNRE